MKKLLFFCFVFFSFTKISMAQCTNPTPSGPNTQTFCKTQGKTVGDIDVSSGNIVWYDEETNGIAYNHLASLTTGIYYADDKSGGGCSSTRLKVEVFVYGALPDTFVAITECAIDRPTISDLFVKGENIKWFDREIGGNELAPSILLLDGSVYWAQQTENGCTSKRSSTTVTLLDPAHPTVAKPFQNFCKIDKATVAKLDVQLTSASSSVFWYKTETSKVALDPTELLVSGNSYWASEVESSLLCESTKRAKVSVIVNDTPKPTTNSSNQTFCNIDSPKISNIDITGTNIKWYDTATSTVVLNPSDILVSGDYYATQTDATTGCESSERTMINTIVNITSAPIIGTGEDSQLFCNPNESLVSNLKITGTNIKWYATVTSTVILNSAEQLVDGEDYYATQTDSSTGCESVQRTKVSVIYKPINAPSTSNSIQTFCINESATLTQLEVVGINLKWYATATSTTVLEDTLVLENGKKYYAAQTNSTGCESTNRLEISVIVNSTPKPTTITNTQEFCENDATKISNLVITGTNIKWYESATSTNVLDTTTLLIDGEDYFATQTNTTTGCESIERTMVAVVFKQTDAPTTVSDTKTTFCLSDSPTLSSIELAGTNIKWYDTLTSTSALDADTVLEDGKSYYASQTNSTGCESEDRLTVAITLTKVNTPVLDDNGELFCLLKGDFTLSDLNNNVSIPSGNSIIWYDDFPNGTELSLNDVLVHETKYYAIFQNADGCKSTSALEVLVNLEACTDKDLVIYDGFSPNDDGINDVFTIKNIHLIYPEYSIDFYNRWGNIIYEGNANKPFWNGELNGNGELLPKGIYYYILDFKKDSRAPKQGRLYLSR